MQHSLEISQFYSTLLISWYPVIYSRLITKHHWISMYLCTIFTNANSEIKITVNKTCYTVIIIVGNYLIKHLFIIAAWLFRATPPVVY